MQPRVDCTYAFDFMDKEGGFEQGQLSDIPRVVQPCKQKSITQVIWVVYDGSNAICFGVS